MVLFANWSLKGVSNTTTLTISLKLLESLLNLWSYLALLRCFPPQLIQATNHHTKLYPLVRDSVKVTSLTHFMESFMLKVAPTRLVAESTVRNPVKIITMMNDSMSFQNDPLITFFMKIPCFFVHEATVIFYVFVTRIPICHIQTNLLIMLFSFKSTPTLTPYTRPCPSYS